MIISVAGVLGGADLSGYMVRTAGFHIEGQLGARMDTAEMTFHDPALQLAFPDRAEMWVYDAAAGGAVTDPPGAVSAYNTFLNGAGHEVTSPLAANWTPRLFAGYVADPRYWVEGPTRYCSLTAQDYTVRLRFTVANRPYSQGNSDQFIIRDMFAAYRPDVDTSDVALLLASMPSISFPVHTLEQFLQKIVKYTRGIYRVDYFKRLHYGSTGFMTAPFGLSDAPDGVTTFGIEAPFDYTPAGSGLSNKVWIKGSTYLSARQSYTVPSVLVNGTTYQFPLPGNPEKGDAAAGTTLTVTVGGAGQTVGVAPGDGDVANPSGWKAGVTALLQHSPATLSLKVPPGAGVTVVVSGLFRYPLLAAVTDQALLAAAGGQLFESVISDKRIADLATAQAVGKAFLKQQGAALKGGTVTCRKRSLNGVSLQPGMTFALTHARLFQGLLRDAVGNPTTTVQALITKLSYRLDDDTGDPYEVDMSWADRNSVGY